jgi:hypothetical protein
MQSYASTCDVTVFGCLTIKQAPPTPDDTSATARTWIFQSNPELFRLDDALRTLPEMPWLVVSMPSASRLVYRVFLWAGSHAGIVAVARCADHAEVREGQAARQYYLDWEKFAGPQLRVLLRIDRVCTKRISKSAVKAHPAHGSYRSSGFRRRPTLGSQQRRQ